MIIEKIPKREVPEGGWISHNIERTIISMTKDEAVFLISELVKFLHEDKKNIFNCPDFPDGLWYEKGITFAVFKEKDYLEHLYELRKIAEENDD